jgi:uncharacterized membrane protein YphA (DoxX/SURF4 family)
MTILTLFLYIGIAALALTGIISRFRNTILSFPDSLLQNFAGILFVFSGFVKAVDPMGTAFKMEQYFTAFEDTCKGSFLSFMSPVFPALTNYALSFSVVMIVLEIVLGITLILGYKRKFSAWLFLIIMVFFTVLTGFTYLTGYVPSDVNFFEFSKWTAFQGSQMRVTDCGCFGDFIKLEPKISFIKDLFLMIPAIWFLFRWNYFHQLFSPSIRASLSGISLVGLFLFSFSNFIWNEPVIDFRPFGVGVNIRERLAHERAAEASVEILAFKLKNRSSQNELIIPYKVYLDSFKQYPDFKERWETLEQIKSSPKIPRTKISDFEVRSLEGESMTDELLNSKRANFIILSPKVKYHTEVHEIEKLDTLFKIDTINTKLGGRDSIIINKVPYEFQKRKDKVTTYHWDKKFVQILKTKMLPLLDSVKGVEVATTFLVAGLTQDAIINLRNECGINFPTYEADDLLIKTIMRSNPGLLLLRDGQIVDKWHHKQLPDVDELTKKYLNPYADKIY